MTEKKKTERKPAIKTPFIDFSKIVSVDLQGKQVVYTDIGRDLGNHIYRTGGGDLGVLDDAMKIYKTSQIELNERTARMLIIALQDPQCPVVALLRKTLIAKIQDFLTVQHEETSKKK